MNNPPPTPKSKQTSTYHEDSKQFRRHKQKKTKNTVINSSNSSLQAKIDASPQDHIIMKKCDSKHLVNVYNDPENKLEKFRQYCQYENNKVSNSSNSSLLSNGASPAQDSIIPMNADNNRGNVFDDYRQYRHSQQKKNTEANPNGSSRSTNVASVVTKKCSIKNVVNADKNNGDMVKGYRRKRSNSRSSSPFTNLVYTQNEVMIETFDFENTASFYRECDQPRLEHRGNLSSRSSPHSTVDPIFSSGDTEILNYDEGGDLDNTKR